MENSKKKQKNDNILKFFILFGIIQFVLHSFALINAKDPRLVVPTLISYCHDLFIISTVALILRMLMRIPRVQKNSIFQYSFTFIFILSGSLLTSYPGILREYLAFPVNLFDADLSSTKILIFDYLGLAAFYPVLISFILAVLVIYFPINLKISKIFSISFSIIITLLFIVTVIRDSPHPFIYSVQQELKHWLGGQDREVPSLSRLQEFTGETKIRTLQYPDQSSSKFKHILLLVLEGVTAQAFNSEFFEITDGFYDNHKEHIVYYDNYYATNLDSYTSLISMTTAIQVPYRAYAADNLYERVNDAPNLVEYFKQQGFFSIFLSTYEHQPFVPNQNFWNKVLDRNDLPSLNGWLSLGSNKMESATEDKSAISTIVDYLEKNDHVFLLHELVYGHSPEWRAKTEKTQVQYYDEYLTDLTTQLKSKNLFDQTLFVIVSDHGDRANSENIENYHVPLLIVGSNIISKVNSDLLNHLDLPEIIFHFNNARNHPETRKEIFFVGSTEKWVYGKMNSDTKYLFIDDSRGSVLSKKGNLKVTEVFVQFQNYLSAFNFQFNRSNSQ